MKWLFPSRKQDAGPPDAAKMAMINAFRRANAEEAEADVMSDIYLSRLMPELGMTRWAIWFVAGFLVLFIVWAALAELEEVTSGVGKVIPSSREQVVQSAEAGVVAEIMVKEGQNVDVDEPLLRIDDVRLGATVQESQSKIDALMLAAIRLRAESQGGGMSIPPELQKRSPSLVRSERETYEAKRRALDIAIRSQQQALRLAQDELKITEPMAAKGLVSELDVMRIQRSIVEAQGRISELQGKYRADAAAELARVEAELGAQSATLVGREDSLKRTVLRAPKRGIVKNVRVNTIGGFVQAGQELLEIVPADDNLLIETRIRPSDIAFLRPGLPAIVKITAYDSSIYGWLDGTLLQISADTIRDEVKRDETYYRALVRTTHSALKTPDGRLLPIIPGMQAQVDIKTGHKTVLAYLFKPVMRAREALRER